MQLQNIQKRLPLIIAIACGVWAILLLNSYIKRRESEIWEKIKLVQKQQAQPARQQVQMGIALVAAKDIQPQVPITPADLLIKEIPAEYIQPGVVSSLDDVIGQIASAPIAAGEQILKTKLLPPGKIGKSLSEITPSGKRAVNVAADNMASIANLVRPGDRVDVLALIALPDTVAAQAGTKSSTPRLIPLFQAVEVLAVGGEFVASPAEAAAKAKGEQAKAPSVASGTVTLALDPQEAVLLSFVQEHGKVKLDLRSSEDTKQETVKAADWDTLIQYLYPAEAGAEGKRQVVEVYRGLNKELVPLVQKEK
jgi:pilus assembly protein CpaB